MAEQSNVGSSKSVVRNTQKEAVNTANQLKNRRDSDNPKLDAKVMVKKQSGSPPKWLNRGEVLSSEKSSLVSNRSQRMSSTTAQPPKKLSIVQKNASDNGESCSKWALADKQPSSTLPVGERDDERKQGRTRRPDIQIYIPKPKMALLRENAEVEDKASVPAVEKVHMPTNSSHGLRFRQRTSSVQSDRMVTSKQEERLVSSDVEHGAGSVCHQTRASPRSRKNKDRNKKREHEKWNSPLARETTDHTEKLEEWPSGDSGEMPAFSDSHSQPVESIVGPPDECLDPIDRSSSRVLLFPEKVTLPAEYVDMNTSVIVTNSMYTSDSVTSVVHNSLPSINARPGSGLNFGGCAPKGRGRLGRPRCEVATAGLGAATSRSARLSPNLIAGIQRLHIDATGQDCERVLCRAPSPQLRQESVTELSSVEIAHGNADNSVTIGDECLKDAEPETILQVEDVLDQPDIVQPSPRKILDWSAEVEASEENEELPENWSPVWEPQPVEEKSEELPMEETSKELPVKDTPRSRKKKRRDNKNGAKQAKDTIDDRAKSSPKTKKLKHRPEKEHSKKKELPVSDQNDIDRTKVLESATKSGGIIHLPPSVEPPMPAIENACAPLAEREYNKKQLYDPDHPERPLCVVTPASHVSPYEHYQYDTNQPPPAVQRTIFPYPSVTAIARCSSVPHSFMPPQNFFSGYANSFPQMPIPPRGPPYFAVAPGLHPNIPMDFSPSGSNVMYKLSATEKNVREAMILETELNMILSQPFSATDLKKLGQCRWKIQLRYENTILSDMEFCVKHNVEQTLWRAAFYQVIECYRRQMVEDPSHREDIRTALISLIEEGIVFYENLLEKMQETYGFNLNDFLDSNALRSQNLSRTLKSTLMSAQKVTICLGDLARYREYACDSSNYGKARSWYLKAQQLAPKNGRPYNQLAILAVYARRKLDAVYYYMRSLAASNAFQTAKEGLISIFDDARKKYEQLEKTREETRRLSKNSQRNSQSSGQQRRQGVSRHQTIIVWYTPEGNVANQGLVEDNNKDPNRVDDDDDLQNLSAIELNKRFSLSFLHIHGKLYSRVGMETFAEACVRMLHEFRLLLHTHTPTLMANRLLQIITINMYAIYKAGHEATDAVPVESHCQTVIQGRALEVGVEMFRLLVERCCELLRPMLPTAEAFSDDLEQLLPAVKIWCDWFMCHPAVWNPLPSLTDLGDGADKRDVWTELAHLLNLLKEVDTGLLLEEPQEGCELLVLPEDVALAGFIPLLSLSEKPIYVLPPVDKDLARNLLRVYRIVFCTSGFLCGLPSPVLAFDVDTRKYVAVSNDPLADEPVKIQTRLSESDQSEDPVEKFEESTEDWDNCWPDDPTCHHLRTRKQQLEKVKANQEKQQQQIQAVLQEASQSGNVRFEVYPQWLVPDTNCFIDHLQHIRVLAHNGKFHLAVPLVVINELDGLAQGQRGHAGEILTDPTAQAHASMVSRNAQEALQFLTECFQSHNPFVRAITAKGSLLGTIAFRSEETYDKLGTNDDIILACCIKLCEEQSFGRTKFEKFKQKDGVELICRNVVLLTDDRNLRLKAHAYDMAVEAVPRFAELMNVIS